MSQSDSQSKEKKVSDADLDALIRAYNAGGITHGFVKEILDCLYELRAARRSAATPYESLFMAAVHSIAEISRALSIPDEVAATANGNEEILDAIAELQGASDLTAAAAHRACTGVEHDTANGKLHGCCVVCGIPWPCKTAQYFLRDAE